MLMAFGFMLAGTFSSVSSAPLFSLVVHCFRLRLPFRRFWPALLAVLLV